MSKCNSNCSHSNCGNKPCNCLPSDDHCNSKPCRCSPRPFLSSYIEAVGSAQIINNGSDVIFDTDIDTLDIAGRDIVLDESGTTFTLNRKGLYHIEWSINMASASTPLVIGLLENGNPVSALANAAVVGNHSSGALINVNRNNLPYTINLHNFGAPITLADATAFQNVAVSIRILRFADGPAL